MEAGESVAADVFASLSLSSLCKGLFLPLSMLHPERTAAIFGIETPPPPDAAAREALLQQFLAKDLGLDLVQKLSCILGDAFRGKKSTFKRDSLITLLTSMELVPRRAIVDRLTVVGEVAVLFAEHRPAGRLEPPLTSAEVLEALRFLPEAPRLKKLAILRSLLNRMGKLEAYFIRMLHKSTDASGAMLAGAYTRTRGDWLELVAVLEQTIKLLPVRDCIIDGELHGTVFSEDGPEPATVYDVFALLTGQPARPVALKYVAFDVLSESGRDLTGLPLSQRRQRLQQLMAPMAMMPTPVPLSIVDGQLAQSKEDANKLFQFFRGQGYEGIIAKDLAGIYRINTRDPSWVKRKPVITLDLVLLARVLAVTTKEWAGMFGSYAIGARKEDGSFEDVGDVAGLDVERDRLIQQEIVREGLITGRCIERPSASGVRPGLELRPHIMATVKFEGITRDTVTKRLSLRDPKIVRIRSDKAAHEADTARMIEEPSVRERFA